MLVLRVFCQEHFSLVSFFSSVLNDEEGNFKQYVKTWNWTIPEEYPGDFSGSPELTGKTIQLIEKLLSVKLSKKIKTILRSYSSALNSNSLDVRFFHLFSAFEGIIKSWGDENGFSELWGHAISSEEEQKILQNGIRNSSFEYVNSLELDDEKKEEQLREFIHSNFPKANGIKLRRTLKQVLKDYLNLRLSEEQRKSINAENILENFRDLYEIRNKLGHSYDIVDTDQEFLDDLNLLIKTTNDMLRIELESILKGRSDVLDWKTEVREDNLNNYLEVINSEALMNIVPEVLTKGAEYPDTSYNKSSCSLEVSNKEVISPSYVKYVSFCDADQEGYSQSLTIELDSSNALKTIDARRKERIEGAKDAWYTSSGWTLNIEHVNDDKQEKIEVEMYRPNIHFKQDRKSAGAVYELSLPDIVTTEFLKT